eukprot:scaffold292_cov376-Prasinococcus_capsulatus_cf.AAC.5
MLTLMNSLTALTEGAVAGPRCQRTLSQPVRLLRGRAARSRRTQPPLLVRCAAEPETKQATKTGKGMPKSSPDADIVEAEPAKPKCTCVRRERAVTGGRGRRRPRCGLTADQDGRLRAGGQGRVLGQRGGAGDEPPVVLRRAGLHLRVARGGAHRAGLPTGPRQRGLLLPGDLGGRPHRPRLAAREHAAQGPQAAVRARVRGPEPGGGGGGRSSRSCPWLDGRSCHPPPPPSQRAAAAADARRHRAGLYL